MAKIRILLIFWVALSGAGGRCYAASAQSLVLEQVEFQGVKAFTESELEGVLELQPGDVFNRDRAVATGRRLQALYDVRGYPKARIRSELIAAKGILIFTVEEGEPTRIAGITFISRLTGNLEFEAERGPIENRLVTALKLVPGDILDQQVLAQARTDLTTAIAEYDYIGADFTDIRIEPASGPSGDWVRIEIYYDPGAKVTFGFRGNTVLSRADLNTLVEDQRVVGFGKGFIEGIKSKIVERYHAMGYAHATIDILTFERPEGRGRHISYRIDEGPRVRIESVKFDGIYAFTAEELKARFFEHAPVFVAHDTYVEAEVLTAAELLAEWLKTQGYLSAKLVTVSRVYIRENQGVEITVFLYEGVQTLVEEINFKGLTAVPSMEARKVLSLREGEPLNLFAFSDGLDQLKAMYRDLGYFDIAIPDQAPNRIIKYSRNNRQALITMDVQEGVQYKTGKITIEGLTKTKSNIVEREFRFTEGEVLRESQIQDTERRLRRLGVFSTASVTHEPDAERPGVRNIRVSLTEGTPGSLVWGVGLRSDLGVRVFGSFSYASIWHRNHTGTFSGELNRRFEDYCVSRSAQDICFLEYRFRLGYVWPWFVADEVTFRPEITQEKRRFKQFDAQSSALTLSWDRRLFESINLTGGFAYNLERTIQFNAKSELDNQALTIGSIIPLLRLDLRDDPLAPKSGFLATGSYEIASTAFGSQVTPFPIGFTRAQFRADQFIPLSKSIKCYLSFRTGYERNTVEPRRLADGSNDLRIGIPLSKQFALGGAGSLRGFRLQELNVQDKVIQGTLSYVNYRTQIDVPISGGLLFGPFLDAANLLVDSYSFGKLRVGTGFGFHYDTPVGPINFDWGFKLARRANEDSSVFHFSVGVL